MASGFEQKRAEALNTCRVMVTKVASSGWLDSQRLDQLVTNKDFIDGVYKLIDQDERAPLKIDEWLFSLKANLE
jgi:hypothetical protein